MKKSIKERTKEQLVGCVTEYDHASRKAEVKLCGTLRVGNKIHIKHHRSDWYQRVESLHVADKPQAIARSGQLIWLGVINRPYKDDRVFVVLEIESSLPVGPSPYSPVDSPNGPPINTPPSDTPPSKTPHSPSGPHESEPGPLSRKRKSSKRGKREDDEDDDDEPDLPDPFEIDSEEKKKKAGEGG